MTPLEQELVNMRNTLGRYRFRFSNERDLQDGLEKVMRANNWEFQREYSLSDEDRPDFFLSKHGIAVEVKVDGSSIACVRQLHRYAQHEAVKGFLFITARFKHKRIPVEISGKPLECVRCWSL